MSTEQTLQISTNGSEETEALGKKIGSRLRGGEVIELISDLGGGKTTFTRGLAAGLGSSDKVSSPTFTVSKEYRAGNKRLVHYDFYRLADAGIMSYEIAEVLQDPLAVVVVEWADVVQDILSAERIVIKIQASGGEAEPDSRILEISYPKKLSYIFAD